MPSDLDLIKKRKLVEAAASFGLLLICVALVAPLTAPANTEMLTVFRWIYGSGALIYLVARLVDVNAADEPLRLRRLRRMEFWAGIAFGFATAFWFYEAHRLGENAGALAVLQNTILFTLVGALIQIVASWMIYSQQKKGSKDN